MSQAETILELTGPLERAVGHSHIRLANTDGCGLGLVLVELVRQYPAAANVLGSVDKLIAADGALPAGLLIIRETKAIAARMETPVAAGDRLTLMPMVSGG